MKDKIRIGILTITPNIGIGGIMQAYALQNAVTALSNNLDVEIINYRNRPTLKTKLAYFKNSLIRKFFRREYVKFSEKSTYKYIGENILPFHEKYLQFSPLVYAGESFRNLANKRYSIIIVGSDQVWRPKYVLSIRDYFLEGISDTIYKIAYAASLGTSNWEYSFEDTKCCRQLLKQFDYISIRELEGVNLLKENLGYSNEIYNDIDPTLLLPKDNYNKFLVAKSRKNVFTYILDKTQDKEQLVNQIATILNLPVYTFNTGAENANLPLNERIAPSIEEWLSGIANSDFVVTDSFHGCVFSIIFNKPFIVYANRDRGVNRFTSLLDKLGIQNKMVFSAKEFSIKQIFDTIDWDNVNNTIGVMRSISLNRLSNVIREKI